jgi:hypothetical protein
MVGRAEGQSGVILDEYSRLGRTDNPDPDDLECPESSELEEMRSHVVKSGIGARLEDSEE